MKTSSILDNDQISTLQSVSSTYLSVKISENVEETIAIIDDFFNYLQQTIPSETDLQLLTTYRNSAKALAEYRKILSAALYTYNQDCASIRDEIFSTINDAVK